MAIRGPFSIPQQIKIASATKFGLCTTSVGLLEINRTGMESVWIYFDGGLSSPSISSLSSVTALRNSFNPPPEMQLNRDIFQQIGTNQTPLEKEREKRLCEPRDFSSINANSIISESVASDVGREIERECVIELCDELSRS